MLEMLHKIQRSSAIHGFMHDLVKHLQWPGRDHQTYVALYTLVMHEECLKPS